MTLYTQGWDLVAATTQQVLNGFLLALYNDGALPKTIDVSYEGVSMVGTLGAPTINLNPSRGVGTNSLAQISLPVTGTVTFFGNSNVVPAGTTLNVTTNLRYLSVEIQGGTAARLSLDLTSNLAVYNIAVKAPLAPPWVAFLNGILQFWFSQQSFAGVYYLGTVDLSSVPGPLLPQGSAYFATQQNVNNPNVNALAMVANTSSGSPGVLDFTGSAVLLPTNQTAALYISNRCLLVNLVLPQIASALNTANTSFTVTGATSTPYNLGLNTEIDLSGEYDPDLDTLNIYVNGNGQIQGDYDATGYPIGGFHSIIWVDVDGYFTLTPAQSGQAITFSSYAPNGSGSIHLSTGGWFLIGALIIATFGSLGAALVAVVAVVVPVVISQLKLSISMSALQTLLASANVSFSWPAQSACPLVGVGLPGDLVLYLAPSP
ncbi:MAG TPA: hypothetical protein VEX43_10335 [Chthoniobacterales bacterium]|nr:hypothetical protein [Chthoniobacterales bacterium]